jgi:hypothetical protein
MSDRAVRHVIRISFWVVLLALVASVLVFLSVSICQDCVVNRPFSEPAKAIYATNTWVALRNDETATADAGTKYAS